MFGLGWDPGRATVVSRRLLSKSFDGASAQSYTVFEYMLDVHPDDGTTPYRATAKDPFNMIHWRQPEIGDEVRVRCHVKNRDVKFDHDDPGLHQDTPNQAYKKEVKAARSATALDDWEALRDGTPEVRPHQREERPAPNDDMAALAASITDTANTLGAIKAARAAGDADEVARLKAEFQHRAGEREAGSPISIASILTGMPHTEDRIERLEKLANLHDRGILTDAEFAAEKAKILADDGTHG